jgi:hypothetical protein
MPEFGIETKEIDRRKKAFTTLIASFTAGLILGLVLEFYNSLAANLWIYIGCLIVLSSILFLLRWMLFKFFHSYLQVKISWSGQYLLRKGKKLETYLLTDLKGVQIKQTVRGTIREIKICLIDGNSLYVNALQNIGQFKEELLSKIGGKIVVKELKEHIDYDHPIFYLFFGLLVGFLAISLIKLLEIFNYKNINIFYFAVFSYAVLLGIYFLLKKPVSKRHGIKTQSIDYVFGLLLICAA